MNRSKSLSVILLLVLVLAPSIVNIKPVQANSTSENTWSIKAPLPTNAYGEAAAVNGKIYMIGSSTNYMYDPSSDTWFAKTPIPTSQGPFSIAAFQDRIYAFTTTATEVYDPTNNFWQPKQRIPHSVYSQLDANVVDGQIYFIGGHLNQIYNVLNDSWTNKTAMPVILTYYTSAVSSGKIYFFGDQGENWIYDPVKDEWSQGSSPPITVLSAAAVATTGIMAPERIYLIGGNQPQNISGTNIVQVYDPKNDSWGFGAAMPTARTGVIACVSNDLIYAMGGSDAITAPTVIDNEQYTPFGYGTSVQPPPSSTPTVSEFPIMAVVSFVFPSVFVVVLVTRKKRH